MDSTPKSNQSAENQFLQTVAKPTTGSLGNLVIRTIPVSNTHTPVRWNIDGILAENIFSIRVKEADVDLFCSDDNMGTVIVPPNYTGGVLENIDRDLKIAIVTEEVYETTFTSSILIDIEVQNKILTSCQDSMYILGLKEPYNVSIRPTPSFRLPAWPLPL